MIERIGIGGIGVLAPGLDGWPAARASLTADAAFAIGPMRNPAPPIMPAAERRRASLAIRLALEVAHQAVTDAACASADLACVFTSCDGDGDTIHAVCTTLTEPGYPVSPTRFSNSVHNAPAGYWSIACGVRKPSTSVCGFDASFAVGLLEAATQVAIEGQPVLLVASDVPLPPPLAALHPTHHPFGAAFVLLPADHPAKYGTFGIAVDRESAGLAWPSSVPEALRVNAAAQALRLLVAVAFGKAAPIGMFNGVAGNLRIDYRP